jgi:arylsulfate sulfotransferase
MKKLVPLLGLLFLVITCGCGSSPKQVANISLTPESAAVVSGGTLHFTAISSDGSAIEWLVNGIPGGNPVVGKIDTQGNYFAPAHPLERSVALTAKTRSLLPTEAFASIHVVGSGEVLATKHPQVARYTINLPEGTNAFVQFGTDGNYGLRTWTESAQPGGTTNFLIAGMTPFTQYHLRAVVAFPDGSHLLDTDHLFTTGGLQPGQEPNIAVHKTAGTDHQGGIELIDAIGGAPIPIYATNLDGQIIWWYQPPDGSSTDVVQPVQQLPNGHFLVSFGPGSTDILGGVVEPQGTVRVLREIDLTGITVREISVDDLNSRLASAGFNLRVDLMHHDVAPLPNGHWVVIANEIRAISGLNGFTGQVNVLGDDVIDLDESLKPVWVWSSFDHLDVNRHPFQFPDWTHSNAIIYLPKDGDLLLSIRHQNWIIKIDYRDGKGGGDIIWRLGSEGDFTLSSGVDPTDWFYAQHGPAIFSTESATIFSLSVMDNGNDRQFPAEGTCATIGTSPCPYSTVGIYRLDETSKTATLTFHDAVNQFAQFGGDTRALANGNLEFDLCAVAGGPPHSTVMEVTPWPSPGVVWQLDVDQFAYRAFRIPSFYPGVPW